MELTLSLPYQIYWHNSLKAYQFPILKGTTHAIFTRLGGYSPPPWHSLNMGYTVGDASSNVKANFSLACNALGVNPKQTVSCHLIHGNNIVLAPKRQSSLQLGKADGIITQNPDICLTMCFGDCTPLLFYDAVTESIGLAHAGWRGTMQNVVGMVVKKMQYHFQSKPNNICLVIGPSIGPCCYQVQKDVLQTAETLFCELKLFFRRKREDLYFDLWQANAYQANKVGLTQVVLSNLCTACQTNEFFSHRVEKGKTGRFAAFLSLAKSLATVR